MHFFKKLSRILCSRLSKLNVGIMLSCVVVIAITWGLTIERIGFERRETIANEFTKNSNLAMAFEEQTIGTLDIVKQTVLLMTKGFEDKGRSVELRDLADPNAFDSGLIIALVLFDSRGDVIRSDHILDQTFNVADRDYFKFHRDSRSTALHIGQPLLGRSNKKWQVPLTMRINRPDGSFGGVSLASIDPAYLTRFYKLAKLGDHGLGTVIGLDGITLSRQVGAESGFGEDMRTSTLWKKKAESSSGNFASTGRLDGITRLYSYRTLLAYPIVVMVGTSTEVTFADSIEREHRYIGAAAIATLLIFLFSVGMMIAWTRITSRTKELGYANERLVLEAEKEKDSAKRIEQLAYYDGLTGLPNRTMFSKLLEQHLKEARRYNKSLAVLFVDLDRFKNINDTLGHPAGDTLLQEVGHRLKTSMRSSDVVARLGGDEFVVLLPELQDEKTISAIAQKLIVAISKSFTVLGQEFRITASIGATVYPRDGEDERALMKNADIAMYQAKAAGKNTLAFYSETLNANSFERLALESSLRHALELNQFALHYQPKVSFKDDSITGVEALLRWSHPDLGTVSPANFIPIAEEIGLIVPIGRWVLRTACEQNVRWQKAGLPALVMAVNLSPRQFADGGLLRDVTEVLKDTQMDPALLELEITESMLMQDPDAAVETLTMLKALGIRLSVDDFGTGYSSLSNLKRFPVDTIKIDRSFVRDLSWSSDDRGITQAIIAMGKTLRMTVIAEGVETQEQKEILRAESCDEFQGFHFSKAVPADNFERLARQSHLEETLIAI